MLHAVEIAAGLLAVLALTALVTFVAVTFTRRRLIAHGADVVVCGLRPDSASRWRIGLLRLSSDSLQWYPMLGLTPKTSQTWVRRSIDLGTPQPLEPDTTLSAVIDKVLRVPVRGTTPEGEDVPAELGLSPAPYTTLRAWVEACPPSGWPVQA
ncbi:DUF2550 family protein [Gephyromycinifex aptenodytis]|uniref:DUF2550 family protein n=1 Tax=Gephyromycinifex aptenodytis TaxID=2716227 RepID=UPI00144526E0|nr:DUF2550 family protein [Gephyromycinifex aptenodytis]